MVVLEVSQAVAGEPLSETSAALEVGVDTQTTFLVWVHPEDLAAAAGPPHYQEAVLLEEAQAAIRDLEEVQGLAVEEQVWEERSLLAIMQLSNLRGAF